MIHTRPLGDVIEATLAAPTGVMLSCDRRIREWLAETGDGASSAAAQFPDAELVHRMRVAARRLRSDLASLRPFIEPSTVDHLRAELRWLGGLLGEVRDGQLLHADLAEREDTRVLLERLTEQLAPVVGRLRVGLNGERYAALLEYLTAASASPPLRSGIGGATPALPALMARNRVTWRKLRSVGRTAEATGREADIHELRKVVKRTRYLAELSAPVVGRGAKRAAERLATLQDLLGARRDAVNRRAWLSAQVEGLDSTTAFRAGQLDAEAERSPAMSSDWEGAYRRALKHRPSRWARPGRSG